jgi:hypothetical protein
LMESILSCKLVSSTGSVQARLSRHR